MESSRPLAPTLISHGTLSDYRDMLRALETLENLEYRYVVDGDIMDEGSAALVKLMAEPESSTLVVNGCLFLNVASFRYLDFQPAEEGRWSFILHGDGSVLELLSLPDSDESGERERPRLLSLEESEGFESLILLDDEDDEE
jgi:hypothetical protein